MPDVSGTCTQILYFLEKCPNIRNVLVVPVLEKSSGLVGAGYSELACILEEELFLSLFFFHSESLEVLREVRVPVGVSWSPQSISVRREETHISKEPALGPSRSPNYQGNEHSDQRVTWRNPKHLDPLMKKSDEKDHREGYGA